jgi:cytochrome c oxidase assembly protein subunit 15
MANSASTVHRATRILVGLTLGLVVAGGLVTSRDAGLAVPDWPLSFGTVNPPQWYAIENVRTEHGHRLIAGSVALATLALGWLILRRETRVSVRRLGIAAMAGVLFQAALGGLRVLHLSIDLAMVHACVGQIFFTLVVCLAAITSPHWITTDASEGSQPDTSALRLTWGLAALVVSQLLLGIVLRHQGAAARPLTANLIFFVHAMVAFGIYAAAMQLRTVLSECGHYLQSRATLLVRLILAQLALGVITFALTEAMTYERQATLLESWIPTLHVAIGASILGLTSTLLLHVSHRSGIAVPAPPAGTVQSARS